MSSVTGELFTEGSEFKDWTQQSRHANVASVEVIWNYERVYLIEGCIILPIGTIDTGFATVMDAADGIRNTRANCDYLSMSVV